MNLDFKILHVDYNSARFKELREALGSGVHIEVSRPESLVLLSAERSDLDIGSVMSRFGLEARQDYVLRARSYRFKNW